MAAIRQNQGSGRDRQGGSAGRTRSGTLALFAALGAFMLFFGNVALGASGRGEVLGDVGEMLTMFAAALLFTVGVLQREAAATRAEREQQDGTSREDVK